jgi:hypothetical protein
MDGVDTGIASSMPNRPLEMALHACAPPRNH